VTKIVYWDNIRANSGKFELSNQTQNLAGVFADPTSAILSFFGVLKIPENPFCFIFAYYIVSL